MAGAPIPIATTQKILSILDLRAAADARLPTSISDFYNHGSTDQRTLAANEAALSRYFLRSRVLVDVKDLDPSTTCLGVKIKFPVCTAPAGIQAAAHPDGEKATSRAIAKFGVNQAISSFASFSTKDIIREGGKKVDRRIGFGGSYAIQVYPMRDRLLQERIIRKAESDGCRAVFLTGDSPVLGVRYNEWRNDFRTPEGISYPILERSSKMIRDSTHDSNFQTLTDDSANWKEEIKWIRQRTKMRIYVKGVMCAEDVTRAIAAGCDGVIVSNHGGRQLDGVPGTMDVLEECVNAAEAASSPSFEVHVDGGIRRGSDVFVAMALGATCVWVGRPTLWGLAYDGERGVHRMLEILYEDFRRCMALCGCRTIKDITRACIARMSSDGVLRPLTVRDARL